MQRAGYSLFLLVCVTQFQSHTEKKNITIALNVAYIGCYIPVIIATIFPVASTAYAPFSFVTL